MPWNEANALQKMGRGCSGRGSGVIEPIRCGCCVDAELKGCAWQGASMSLVEDRPVSDTEWLRDGAVRHRAGCRLWVLQGCDADADAICRFAVLCYRPAAGGRRFGDPSL
jgi:hypothetical protein